MLAMPLMMRTDLVVKSFFMNLVNLLHKLFELLTNWFDVKILFQPSAARPEGSAATLVLSIAFFTLSASIGIW